MVAGVAVKRAAIAGVSLAVLALSVANAVSDFGVRRDQEVRDSRELFGVGKPLEASSTTQITQAQAVADPTKLVTLASGLRARVVSAGVAGANVDQISLWPDDSHPTHLIFCNEEGVTSAGLQRLRLHDGLVETIVTGTTSCDPTRRTPWGTILFGEEAGGGTASGGRMYELINPLATTGVTLDRVSGTFSGGTGAQNLMARNALGRLSFEGLALYDSGVVVLRRRAAPRWRQRGRIDLQVRSDDGAPRHHHIGHHQSGPVAAGRWHDLRPACGHDR